MNGITETKRAKLFQLREDIRIVLGEKAHYALYVIKRGGVKTYAVNISYGADSESALFGTRRLAALAAYRKTVAHLVTPCTLRDVAEDLDAGKCKIRIKRRAE